MLGSRNVIWPIRNGFRNGNAQAINIGGRRFLNLSSVSDCVYTVSGNLLHLLREQGCAYIELDGGGLYWVAHCFV